MTQVTKKQTEVIGKEIEIAVKAILEKHNMELTKVRGKYGDVFAFSVEASPINRNENGVNLASSDARTFMQVGKDYGFENPADTLGKTFTSNRKTFKFVGLNLNKRKFPVCAVDLETNQSFGFTLVALRKIEGFNADLIPTWMRDDFQLTTSK